MCKWSCQSFKGSPRPINVVLPNYGRIIAVINLPTNKLKRTLKHEAYSRLSSI